MTPHLRDAVAGPWAPGRFPLAPAALFNAAALRAIGAPLGEARPFSLRLAHAPPPTPIIHTLPHQVLVVDLANPATDLPRAGPPAPAPDRFTRVAWGTIGADGPHPVRFSFGVQRDEAPASPGV